MTQYGEHSGLEKIDLTSKDLTQDNIQKIAQLFPQVMTEDRDESGQLRPAIDFDKLKQFLSQDITEGRETYEFTWVGKREAIAEAGRPTSMTLRPDLAESVNFAQTENVFITGDNLEVLKILQESYLGKVDMIYIDPPYNTGKDFVYSDRFQKTDEELAEDMDLRDEEGRLRVGLSKNEKSSARYHSDWLNMMYPRLILARNLLKDSGVIFISIDENEFVNLKVVMDEVFGEASYLGDIVRKTRSSANDSSIGFNQQHEYVYAFAKKIEYAKLKGEEKDNSKYKNPDNDPAGAWVSDNPSARSGGSNSSFAIQNPKNGHIDYPPKGRYWAFSQSTFDEWVKIGKVIFKDEVKEGGRGFIVKKYLSELKSSYNTVNSLFGTDNQFMNQVATKHLRDDVFEGVDLFTSPKPLGFIKKLVKYSTDKSSLILDFFAGSATTADAVMQLNAEDGGQRRYILCTLDEAVADKSAAKEAGYETIDQISRERIRRAAKKIQAEHPETVGQQDFGFKAYRLDSSNFKDVSKTPDQFEQGNLFDSVDHIKDDRSSLDLLYQVMLSWGMELSLSIHKEVIDDCEVYDVDNGSLIACFDNGMSEALIQSIAKREPLRAVFKDQAFANSSAKINLEQIFKDHSPMTKVKVV